MKHKKGREDRAEHIRLPPIETDPRGRSRTVELMVGRALPNQAAMVLSILVGEASTYGCLGFKDKDCDNVLAGSARQRSRKPSFTR